MLSSVNYTWHEFNGQHAFMRDEGARYDGELALMVSICVHTRVPGCLPSENSVVPIITLCSMRVRALTAQLSALGANGSALA